MIVLPSLYHLHVFLPVVSVKSCLFFWGSAQFHFCTTVNKTPGHSLQTFRKGNLNLMHQSTIASPRTRAICTFVPSRGRQAGQRCSRPAVEGTTRCSKLTHSEIPPANRRIVRRGRADGGLGAAAGKFQQK